jgi:hypothetical protein
MTTRSRLAAAGAALLLAATATAAGAQNETAVSTALTEPNSPMLEVTDLVGQPLTALALSPGRPSAFRVGVRHELPTTMDGYTVESSMGNLYATTGPGSYDFTTSIPSNEVTLAYATSPLNLRDAAAQVEPTYALGTISAITCQALAEALGVTLLSIVEDPICVLLDTISGGLTFSGIPVDGLPLELDLAGLLPTELPLVPVAGQDQGVFAEPDCLHGLGFQDSGCGSGTAGTEHTMMAASKAASLDAAVNTVLSSSVPATLVSADDTGTMATLTDIVTALATSGDANVSDFATSLANDFSEAEQILILNDLVTGVVQTAGIGDVIGVGGLFNAFPTLTVDPATTTPGTYTGTLTIRLIECPSCP